MKIWSLVSVSYLWQIFLNRRSLRQFTIPITYFICWKILLSWESLTQTKLSSLLVSLRMWESKCFGVAKTEIYYYHLNHIKYNHILPAANHDAILNNKDFLLTESEIFLYKWFLPLFIRYSKHGTTASTFKLHSVFTSEEYVIALQEILCIRRYKYAGYLSFHIAWHIF